jgi:hypothetical protein
MDEACVARRGRTARLQAIVVSEFLRDGPFCRADLE